MKTVTVGIIGGGRAAELHCLAYKKVYGINVKLKYIFDCIKENSQATQNRFGIENISSSLEEILDDAEVDVVDICTPPYAHKDIIIKALGAGKHVICEKPLCGYFGADIKNGEKMLKSVLEDIAEIEQALLKSGKLFMYAENFIYAPSVQKAAEIIRAKGSKILYAKGEESLAGSSSPVASRWDKTGGGSLIRVGCHPLSAILWLKRQQDGGGDITVKSVLSDLGLVTAELSEYEHRHIKAAPVDVEDTATVCLTFSDNTKAVIIACDTRLGGSKNYVELYCNDNLINCNITINDAMSTYFLDEEGLDNVEISEMLKSKCGWNNPFLLDDVMRGYVGEMQDFAECIACGRKPLSDFSLARDTIETIYRAYSCGF